MTLENAIEAFRHSIAFAKECALISLDLLRERRMEKTKRRVCCVMNAKADWVIVRRALESVKSICTHFVVSTDLTDVLLKDAIAQWIAENASGVTFQFERINGGQMRTRLFAFAKPYALAWKCSHFLMLDADDEIGVDLCFEWPDTMPETHYALTTNLDGVVYPFPYVFSIEFDWAFRHPIHEVPESVGMRGGAMAHIAGLTYYKHADMERKPEHYLKHASHIQAWQEKSADNLEDTRMQFYLAQSFKDAGDRERAEREYRKRIAMGGGFEDERFISALEIANILSAAPDDETGELPAPMECIAHYLDAWNMQPNRVEPLVKACYIARNAGMYSLAFMLASEAIGRDERCGGLFEDSSAWGWRRWDEYAIACFYTDRKRICARVCTKLLEGGMLPERERARVEANRRACEA